MAEKAQPVPHRFAGVVADENAVGFAAAPAHPAPQLVQRRQTVPLGVFNHHHGGVGHVHAHLDHGGGDQHVQLAVFELVHHGGFFFRLQLAVHQADAPVGQKGPGHVGEVAGHRLQIRRAGRFGITLLHPGADDVHLMALVDLVVQKMIHVPPLFAGHRVGFYRQAAGGQLVQNGDVQIAVHQKAQRAGDGRGAHHQHMGGGGFVRQQAPLAHAEPVLLVHHRKAKAGKLHSAADYRMGAHHQICFVGGDGRQRGALLGSLHAAGEQRHPQPEGLEKGLQCGRVLGGQNLGGGHEGALVAVFRGHVDARRGHKGFAAAHVPLQQPVHGPLCRHVGTDFGGGPPLGPGGGEGQAVPEGGEAGGLHGCAALHRAPAF